MMNGVLLIIAAGTLVVACLTFLASITDLFKKTIPIKFGFLLNDEIVPEIELSTGDPAKPISLRFNNYSKGTLSGIVLDLRFYRPLALSGTGQALTYIPGKTVHGKTPDNKYYLIRHSELEMVGDDNMDFRVELNTQNKNPGTYTIGVTAYSTQLDYKYKKSDLYILLK